MTTSDDRADSGLAAEDTGDDRRAYVLPNRGARVRDREAGDELLVLDSHATRADEWVIDEIDATVAEANPDYPPGDRVAVCVYLQVVHAEHGRGAPVDVVRASAAFGDLRTYTFPLSRLRATGGDDE